MCAPSEWIRNRFGGGARDLFPIHIAAQRPNVSEHHASRLELIVAQVKSLAQQDLS